MHKYFIALLIFLLAAILIFIIILFTFTPPIYLTEDQVKTELQLY